MILSDQEGEKKDRKARMVACISYKGKIYAYGFNSVTKSHPFQARYGMNSDSIYPHAEVAAIHNFMSRRYSLEIDDCDLYICRLKRAKDRRTHMRGLAKPCSGCMRCISQFNLKRVIYSVNSFENDFKILER